MARIDKYDPIDGGFRAVLGFAPVAADVGKVYSVDINGSGQVIKSVDGTACAGVICMSSLLRQGKPVDVMTDGEIVDCKDADGFTGRATGAQMKAGAAGINTTAGTGKVVGRFIENWRLVVRLGR